MKNILLNTTLIIILSLNFVIAQEDLIVNEFLARNLNWNSDEFEEYDDWIEIYNPTAHVINLAGYFLSDDSKLLTKWEIPNNFADSTIIEPNGHILLWADNQPEQGILHLGFKLNSDGEQLFLVSKDSVTIIDSIEYNQQFVNISMGRNNAELLYFSTPTPLARNSQGYIGITNPPKVSESSSVFSGSKSLSLTSQDNDIIRYTLDGSDPIDSSLEYSIPITVESTTIIRARAFKNDFIPSEIISNTYLQNSTSTLPSLVLVTDPPNLFSDTSGIYIRYGQRGIEWEREVSSHFFTNNEFQYSINSGIRIQGSTSRKLPKKSFRLFFRDEYGANRLNYKLFRNTNLSSFKNIVLRGGYDEDLTQPKGTLLRDPLVSELWYKMGELTSQGTFSKMFINNDLWGIYNIRESINEDFIKDHLYYTDLDLIRYTKDDPQYFPELDYGSMDDWNLLSDFFENNDLTISSNYEKAKQLIDIDNFTNLQVLAQCTQYFSWGYGVFAYKEKRENAKWKWTIWDMDRAYTTYSWNEFSRYNLPDRYWYYKILNKLLKNNEYKHFFVNRLNDLLNTLFLPENTNYLIDSLANVIESEIPNEAIRWNSTVEKWNSNVAGLKDFANRRPNTVRTQMLNFFGLKGEHNIRLNVDKPNCKIKVNSVTLDKFPWNGIYSEGIPVTIEALADKGYYFKGWSNPDLPNSSKITINIDSVKSITAQFEKLITQDYYEIIAPSKMKNGEFIPIVVRVKSADNNLKSEITNGFSLSSNGGLIDSTSKIKKGIGTIYSQINDVSSFEISVNNDDFISQNKNVIVIDDIPIINLGGTLAGDLIYWNSDNEYLIDSDLTIPKNTHLIINEGTRVLIGEKVNIFVYGSIEINGIKNNPVIFMPQDSERPWGGIEFFNSNSKMEYCFWVNGGGDETKTWKHSAEFGVQPILFGKENSELSFENVFILNSPKGKAIAANESIVNLTRSVIANVFHGGEFWYSRIHYNESHIMNIPSDDRVYVQDQDNDGMHIDNEYSGENKLSIIENCFFLSGKDDGIDQQNAYLLIKNTWIEDWIHEGLATSNEGSPIVERNTVNLFNVVVKNCDNGIEAGHGSPKVFVDHCVVVDCKNGIRHGDEYSKQSLGQITVTNSILYNNDDNIRNYDKQLDGPTLNDIKISFSMTNDSTYNNRPFCITGTPTFQDNFFIVPGSLGTGLGMEGTNLGLVGSNINQESTVVINEIMYDASIQFDTKDWVEIYNPQTEIQNVSNWILKDNNSDHSFILPQNTGIMPESFLVIVADTTNFKQFHPDVTNVVGNFDFNFGEDDQVRLFSYINQLVDSVGYKSISPWPLSPNGQGSSLELTNFSIDNTLHDNWKASIEIGGSPGNVNGTFVGIDSENKLLPLTIELRQSYPNPFNNQTNIEYFLHVDSKISLLVYNTLGQLVESLVDNKTQKVGLHKVTFHAKGISSGIYFYRLVTNSKKYGFKTLTRKAIYLK